MQQNAIVAVFKAVIFVNYNLSWFSARPWKRIVFYASAINYQDILFLVMSNESNDQIRKNNTKNRQTIKSFI